MTTALRDQLSVEDLYLSFGGIHALAGVTFGIRSGELVAIIGPNGAGKSSLLNAISGLYRPQRGRVEFEGHSLLGRKPHHIAQLGIARTFQNVGVFPSLSVHEYLLMGCRAPDRQSVDEALEMLQLDCGREIAVGTLPYGMQKRVELARALAQKPRLLLLDEPVAGMNRREKETMAQCILAVHRASGATVVLIEHDMGIVMELSERIIVLESGTCIAAGTPAEVRADSAVVRAYLGKTH